MEKRIIRSTNRHSSRVRDPNNSTMAPRTLPFALQIQWNPSRWCSLENMREQPRCHRFLAFKRSRGRDGVSTSWNPRAIRRRGGKEKRKWKQTLLERRWNCVTLYGDVNSKIDSREVMPLCIDPVTKPNSWNTRYPEKSLDRTVTLISSRNDDRRSMVVDPSVSKWKRNVGGARVIFR